MLAASLGAVNPSGGRVFSGNVHVITNRWAACYGALFEFKPLGAVWAFQSTWKLRHRRWLCALSKRQPACPAALPVMLAGCTYDMHRRACTIRVVICMASGGAQRCFAIMLMPWVCACLLGIDDAALKREWPCGILVFCPAVSWSLCFGVYAHTLHCWTHGCA